MTSPPPVLTAEMAKRAIDVSGWFAVTPSDMREAMHALANKDVVCVTADELRRLREDAERYRWLRSRKSDSSITIERTPDRTKGEAEYFISGETADAAIDAARSAK